MVWVATASAVHCAILPKRLGMWMPAKFHLARSVERLTPPSRRGNKADRRQQLWHRGRFIIPISRPE